mmetsp:Transcript_47784/g.108426  ORF Transcript_47784/g.108426 Transcript_47784/m.108426 type:complete len:209 (-) Transcript_47784:19-645(-)
MARIVLLLALMGEAAAFAPRAFGSRLVGSKVAGATARQAALMAAVSPMAQNVMEFNEADPEAFTACILGDLHLDPRYMDDVFEGREHFKAIITESQEKGIPTAVCSLGDLGESKAVDHPSELFAGTTRCHELANEFLSGFGVPYEVVGGNHDLEGIDEFDTDQGNLEAFMRIHGKPAPYFSRQIADKTLLVGLGSTVFRDAKYTSHEV